MGISKWVCAVLVAVLAGGAPLAATAQAPQPYPYPGAERSAKPAEPPARAPEPSAGEQAGAAVLNVFYVPGKFIICGAGTLASAAVMLLTFGSGYRAAVGVFKEGCHGDWALTPEHVAGRVPPKEDID